MPLKRPCVACGDKFMPSGKYTWFCDNCGNKRWPRYLCNFCSEEFRHKNIILEHLQKYHKIKVDRNSVKPRSYTNVTKSERYLKIKS